MPIFLHIAHTVVYLMPMITPGQIRAARALLGIKQTDLAISSGISLATLNNIERGITDPRASTLASIRQALETVGVIFIPENGGGPGVRLKHPLPRPQRTPISLD